MADENPTGCAERYLCIPAKDDRAVEKAGGFVLPTRAAIYVARLDLD